MLLASNAVAEDVSLTLPQARAMAQEALKARDSKLALQIAGGLLKANPKGVYPYFIMAQAYGQLDQYDKGRLAAAQAYKNATTDKERFAAADLAARMSYAGKHPTKAQLWLRRAAQNAPTEQAEQQLGKDYARVRRENPFSFHISGGIRPSNNINNGADTTIEMVNGRPSRWNGRFSDTAVAIEGLVAHVSGGLRYRLRKDERSETVASASLYISRVKMTGDVVAPIIRRPGYQPPRNSDLGVTYATIGIEHRFAVGDKGAASVGLTLGQLWSGGDKYYDTARIDAARHWRVSDVGNLSLTASLERRDVVENPPAVSRDATIWNLGTTYRHKFQNGNRASISLGFGKSIGKSISTDSENVSLSGRYSIANQIGPMQLSFGLSARYATYDTYRTAASLPNSRDIGRNDKAVTADAKIFFPDYDYMGFAPTVTIKAARTFSNFSRFDTKEFSVGLGLQSKF